MSNSRHCSVCGITESAHEKFSRCPNGGLVCVCCCMDCAEYAWKTKHHLPHPGCQAVIQRTNEMNHRFDNKRNQHRPHNNNNPHHDHAHDSHAHDSNHRNTGQNRAPKQDAKSEVSPAPQKTQSPAQTNAQRELDELYIVRSEQMSAHKQKRKNRYDTNRKYAEQDRRN